jgi:hypothetical protein
MAGGRFQEGHASSRHRDAARRASVARTRREDQVQTLDVRDGT